MEKVGLLLVLSLTTTTTAAHVPYNDDQNCMLEEMREAAKHLVLYNQPMLRDLVAQKYARKASIKSDEELECSERARKRLGEEKWLINVQKFIGKQ